MIDIAQQPGAAHSRISRLLLARALIGALMVLTALAFVGGAVTLDTARDLQAALQVAEGEWPLQGPLINNLMHLGPIWFFLLAPPLAIGGGLSAAMLWMGVLAALKFPLAVSCGRAIQDRALGLWLAALLAIPSWFWIGILLPTHWVMVDAAVLGMLWLQWRIHDRKQPVDWLWLGLVTGLGFHAHPTVLMVLPATPLLAWRLLRREPRHVAYLIGCVLLALLPMVPALIADAREGWPMWRELGRHFGDQQRVADSGVMLDLLRALVFDAGVASVDLAGYLGLRPLVAVLMILLPLVSLWGWRSASARLRWLGAWLLAQLLIGALLLSWMRDRTPFYMMLALQVPWFLWLAIGFRQLSSPWIGRGAMVLVGSLALLGVAAPLLSAQQGLATVNAPQLADVRRPQPQTLEASFTAAYALDQLGARICASEGAIALHGHAAAHYDAALALSSRLRCGARSVALSGRDPAAQHWPGLSSSQRRLLSSRGFDLQRVIPLHPPAPVPPADPRRYPPRSGLAAASGEHSIAMPLNGRSALIATDLLRPYRMNEVVAVRAGPFRVERLASDHLGSTWLCAACPDALLDWQVDIRGNDPASLDLIALEPKRN